MENMNKVSSQWPIFLFKVKLTGVANVPEYLKMDHARQRVTLIPGLYSRILTTFQKFSVRGVDDGERIDGKSMSGQVIEPQLL